MNIFLKLFSKILNDLSDMNESSLEWLCTFFYISGYLFILLLVEQLDPLKFTIERILTIIVLIIFGGVYSFLLMISLFSFYPSVEDQEVLSDRISSSSYFRRHKIQQRIILGIWFFIVINYFLVLSIRIIVTIYTWLLTSAQISNIVVAILVAILIENFFQLLGIGLKNIIKYEH